MQSSTSTRKPVFAHTYSTHSVICAIHFFELWAHTYIWTLWIRCTSSVVCVSDLSLVHSDDCIGFNALANLINLKSSIRLYSSNWPRLPIPFNEAELASQLEHFELSWKISIWSRNHLRSSQPLYTLPQHTHIVLIWEFECVSPIRSNFNSTIADGGGTQWVQSGCL